MNPTLTLTAPIPPSLNNAYTNGRGHGRRVLTKQGRDYKADIAQLLLTRAELLNGFELAIGRPERRIGLVLRLWFRTRQRRIAERHTPERLCLLDADLTKLRLDLLKERHRQARKAQQR